MNNLIIHKERKLEFFGEGEWIDEPDEIYFCYKGIDCAILRSVIPEPHSKNEKIFGGHLCGYIRIPPDHTYYHKKYEDMKIDCHGGLTFGEVSDGHWIGFDCAHLGDFIPSVDIFRKQGVKKYFVFNPVYRNLEFCNKQCKSIVDQLLKIQQEKSHEH
jgi:hypothetical protein